MQQRRINARGIVCRDGKILAVRHWLKSGAKGDFWCLPGGGVDDFESLESAVEREMIEELGFSTKVLGLISGQQFRSNREGFAEELEFYYLLEGSSKYDNIDLSKTTHGKDEISEVKFIDPAKENFLPEFLKHIDLKRFIESVNPVEIVDSFSEKTI